MPQHRALGTLRYLRRSRLCDPYLPILSYRLQNGSFSLHQAEMGLYSQLVTLLGDNLTVIDPLTYLIRYVCQTFRTRNADVYWGKGG